MSKKTNMDGPLHKKRADREIWCRKCGCQMKRRDGKFGPFWGCTGYPLCKNTLSDSQVILGENGDNYHD